MRTAMDKGASGVIALLAQALESGRNEKTLSFSGDPLTQAQVLYSLWLGANLQAKCLAAPCRSKARWRT